MPQTECVKTAQGTGQRRLFSINAISSCSSGKIPSGANSLALV